MSQSEALEIVRAYVRILIQAGIPISRAFLYGSFARGEAHEDSDIDVMLLSDSFDNADDLCLSKPLLYTTKVDHRIEPISIGSERYRTDDISPIIEIVRREGIEISL